jgi:hypothetical protein
VKATDSQHLSAASPDPTSAEPAADDPTDGQASAAPGSIGGPAAPMSSDEEEIRYSLTALGESALANANARGRGARFRGFGPCGAVA